MRLPAEDGKRLMHSEMKIGEARVFLRDAFPEHCASGGPNGRKDGSPQVFGGTAVNLHLQVEHCDAAVQQAAGSGATVVLAPWDAFWGDRSAPVADPLGHSWRFAPTLEPVPAGRGPCVPVGGG